MDEDFVASVKLLVPYVLSRDKLVPKRINGMDVTGEDMLKYVKVSTFYGCTLHSAFNTGVTVILKNHSFYLQSYKSCCPDCTRSEIFYPDSPLLCPGILYTPCFFFTLKNSSFKVFILYYYLN